ncbi:MAG: hypothetical protein Fur0010_13260 [Bdellovibrio sp.]
MKQIHILAITILILVSCGKESNSIEQRNPSGLATINLESDEDHDGLSNYQELKYNLSREEFNRPLITFEKLKLGFRSDPSKSVNSLNSERPDMLLPDSVEKIYGLELISNLTISERYYFEQKFSKISDSLVLDAKVKISHPELFKLKRMRIDLAIFHRPSGKYKFIDRSAILNIEHLSSFEVEFQLTEIELNNLKTFPAHWEFAIAIEDVEWQTLNSNFSWKDIEPHLIHVLSNRKEDVLYRTFTPQHFYAKSDLISTDFIIVHKNRIMENNEQIPPGDLVTIFNRDWYLNLNTDKKYEHLYKKIRNKEWGEVTKNQNLWQRIDIKILKRDLSKQFINRNVEMEYYSLSPCGNFGGRKIRLCGGSSIRLTCDALEEVSIINEFDDEFRDQEIFIDTASGQFELQEWIKKSGAVLLENKILRWEGYRNESDLLTPLKVYLDRPDQVINIGFQEPHCRNAPNADRRPFSLNRRDVRENDFIKIEILNY